MELYKANNQWSTRPADERFSSLEDMHAACTAYREAAREATDVPYSSLRVQADNGEVMLIGKAEVPSRLTHWSFGQLAQRVGAPASYLRDLPATLAAQNINHGLARVANDNKDKTANILLHKNGSFITRSFLSSVYERIWNNDVTGRLGRLIEQNSQWRPAPAAFDGSRGLYASDHDMFAFFVDNGRRVFEKDPNGGLSRGFFVWNSEVGASSFGIMTFLYAYVCGNHIVWGAKGVREIRVRHVGSANDRAFRSIAWELKKYSDSSASDEEAKIESARTMVLGGTKEEVLDRLFGLKVPDLSRKLLSESYDVAEQHVDWYGSPRTVWGMVNGITQVARDMEFADKRVATERAAGKVMQMAF